MLEFNVEAMARSEKISFCDDFKSLRMKYSGSPEGSTSRASSYNDLALRCLVMRCRANDVVEYENIEMFLDVYFRKDLTEHQACRLMTIMTDPMRSEAAKIAEISKQFCGVKPTQLDGFAIWKMP